MKSLPIAMCCIINQDCPRQTGMYDHHNYVNMELQKPARHSSGKSVVSVIAPGINSFKLQNNRKFLEQKLSHSIETMCSSFFRPIFCTCFALKG